MKIKMFNQKKKILLIILVIITLSAITGAFYQSVYASQQRIHKIINNALERYREAIHVSPIETIELDEQALRTELIEFMAQFGDTVSIFYENLETRFSFSHNGDMIYFGASATKAPFAFYILGKAANGETNLNSIHSFTNSDYWGGSGIIRHNYRIGSTFTQERLLYLMIAPSDNIATRILRRYHGLNGFRDFVYNIGGNPDFIQNLTYSYISANEAGLFMREMYRFINADSTYGYMLKNLLLSNRYKFIISTYSVASKSGWAANFGGAWHDMAIIFAPSPYTLSLLSTRAGNTSDRAVYDSISMFIEDFNRRHFGN